MIYTALIGSDNIIFIDTVRERERRACGKVANLLKPSMEQNSCRLTDDVMMSKHIVNSTRLPSFLPGPKI